MAREYSLRLPAGMARPQIIRQISKAADELQGIARGILADGKINQQEAAFFRDWVRNQSHELCWPFPAILQRIELIYSDGVATDEECEELGEMLKALLGGEQEDSEPEVAAEKNKTTRLPLCDPAPTPIQIVGSTFCITGKFAYGSRSKVSEEIENRGGFMVDRVLTDTSYLLVGSFTSRGWKHGTYGNKIESAMSYRDRNHPIHIIGEEHWITFLNPAG